MADIIAETDRLILRDWEDSDLVALHAICADPQVMATIGPLMSREEVAEMLASLRSKAANDGHTFWALQRKSDGRLVGFTGLERADIEPIDGKLEIAWRLASDCWGCGYATEAALAALNWARKNRADEDIHAITARMNTRSRAVMERLGMIELPECAFDHPKVPADSPLRPHVTYTNG